LTDEHHLYGEALEDSAPVMEAYYGRSRWKIGSCVGFITASAAPNARQKWPRGRAMKEFFRRIGWEPVK
jgi:hypothetical protein